MRAFANSFFHSEVLSPPTSPEQVAARATRAAHPGARHRAGERISFSPSGFVAASAISLLLAGNIAATRRTADAPQAFTRDLGTLVLSTREPSALMKKAAAIWNAPSRRKESGARPIGELLGEISDSIRE